MLSQNAERHAVILFVCLLNHASDFLEHLIDLRAEGGCLHALSTVAEYDDLLHTV